MHWHDCQFEARQAKLLLDPTFGRPACRHCNPSRASAALCPEVESVPGVFRLLSVRTIFGVCWRHLACASGVPAGAGPQSGWRQASGITCHLTTQQTALLDPRSSTVSSGQSSACRCDTSPGQIKSFCVTLVPRIQITCTCQTLMQQLES